jgi:2-C-methyl-D-erythritol 2,4-cyclodiphosphate synthase
MLKAEYKIGSGYDVHAFAMNRDLVLGGEKIDHDLGLAGHSDADVLVHAVCDGILGAVGLGDIGDHFPDTDPEYKGISSMTLLRSCAEQLSKTGYAICNLDCTIFAQVPKLSPYKKKWLRTSLLHCQSIRTL